MKLLKLWLSMEENLFHASTNRTKVLISVVDTSMISVKGSGVYPISYSLLAQVIKLLSRINNYET